MSAPTAASLRGTSWRLENLAGTGVLDGVQATLEFPSEGRTSGNGSCNRFNGVVTIKGEAIRFGGIAATRKACAEAVMRQEDAYFSALRSADRFETDGQSLEISAPGKAEPLRFVASRATAERPANSTSRAPAAAALAATSIWIVVGHQNPGISALTDEAARARYGETVRLTPAAAISSNHSRCAFSGTPGMGTVTPKRRGTSAIGRIYALSLSALLVCRSGTSTTPKRGGGAPSSAMRAL